ncbi:FHA domain-containing protein [uncultured Methanobacterium sp.]|uniref:FHA domain-containing protein n=1 Tax=uncultured Methanobacterium sp. TaxID=176306 RepID=UPI002AA826C5|nr:FHA domain-containing protein [uncultured Methanobacterium sp.]
MSQKQIIILIGSLVLLIILLFIFWKETLLNWFNRGWEDVIIAAILAIICGFGIEFLYRKFSKKSKLALTTMVMKPRKLLAKLVLPDGISITITHSERIFGREDFLGILVADELMFIGKEHFKLTRLDDGFYIEDMDTKNGTTVNGEEIKGLGKIKLNDNDQIGMAQTLTVSYHEEDVND